MEKHKPTQHSANEGNAASAIIVFAILLSIGYAILRYHIVGSVPWEDFPFFILNKGTGLGAFILITLNFSLGPMKNLGLGVPSNWLNARKAMGMTGFLLALIHVLMSFLLFDAANYGKFFTPDGGLTLLAGLSMLGGVLAFVVLWGYNLSFQTHLREDQSFIRVITSRRFLLIAMLLGAVHLFFMGYESWLNPASWQAGLPPISLVAFAVFMVGYVINFFGRK